jgi:transglutaminase-like putative cysteine protease
MSARLGSTPAPATVGAAPAGLAASRAVAAPRDSLLVRLCTFGALAAFGAAHWVMLVEEAPAGRTLLVVLTAVGGGAVLALLPRLSLPPALMWGLAAFAGIATLLLGLMAAGLPGRLLLPEHWAELSDGLDRGLAGVQGVEWPYGGPDPWIRLTILLGAPLLLALAAALAFWPARRAAPVLRVAGLAVLLLLYGAAVTEHDPGSPLGRGLVLLLLVAAYLWLPRLPAREAAVGAAVVVGVGVLSLPVAAALDGDRPWWNYHAWTWFGGGKVVTFDWNHEYGPLDWPREGTTLMNVSSDRPHYWKAEALDAFDGFRWYRSGDADQARTGAELPFDRFSSEGTDWDYGEYNGAWDETIDFTVRSLSSNLVVGAGVTYDSEGVRANSFGDGTTRLTGNAVLRQGDSYTIDTYAPDPTAEQMRGAPSGYSSDQIQYTAIRLPNPDESATEDPARQGDTAPGAAAELRQRVFVPLRGDPISGDGATEAAAALQASGYAPMYELAQELTANERTGYDAVKAVERHLQTNYAYSERVPTRPLPLMGFLFEDERGYCQQFSGAMALMLRMSGIPARVAAGFSPGSFNRDTREFRVRDLDAHSWVEVWFTGIGWVPFDPTPAAAPAESQSSASATSAAAADAGEVRVGGAGVAPERVDSGPATATPEDGGANTLVVGALLLVVALGAGTAVLVTRRISRAHTLGPSELAEVQLRELRGTLERLGWDVPATTTLLALERRLGRFAGPRSAAYAEALRASRYDKGEPPGPGLGERRAVRRELTRGNVRDRLRGLLAMPPGAPRT